MNSKTKLTRLYIENKVNYNNKGGICISQGIVTVIRC